MSIRFDNVLHEKDLIKRIKELTRPRKGQARVQDVCGVNLSGSHKVYLRRYYRKNRNRILSKIKQRKRTIHGIQHDKKKARMAARGRRADGSFQKKNNIKTKGQHRTVN
jgi:hypothetical protein